MQSRCCQHWWRTHRASGQHQSLHQDQHVSITIADAPPPPLQMAATPNLADFASRTVISRTMIAAPEAPIGWPIATAPPCALTLLRNDCNEPWVAHQ